MSAATAGRAAPARLPTEGPLLSPQWFRVATLRPQLDPRVTVQRHLSRGQVWQVLVHPDGQRSFRLDPVAWSAVGRCEGQDTLQQLWEQLLTQWQDDAPTQDELLSLLLRLQTAGLLNFDRPVDVDGVGGSLSGSGSPAAAEMGRGTPPAAAQGATSSSSWLAWRWCLGHPDAHLARWAARVPWLFSRACVVLWALGVAAAGVAAWLHGPELLALWHTGSKTPHWMALAWVVYPVMKALHELAHGLTLRHWGGVVPQWGVSWWLLTPVPFVEASSAAALPQRRQRAAVAAAGIMVELALAAVALALALSLQPGPWRDAALVVVFVGGVSSLVVNANPLLRFDGYHVLCDVLDLPNLATRSRRFWLDLGMRWGLRLPEGAGRLEPLPGERWALWLYAPLAWGMRLSVWWAVWVWLAGVSAVLGVLAALYGAWGVLGQPLWTGWRWWRQQAWTAEQSRQTQRRVAFGVVLVGTVVCGVPLPDTTVVQGVVWLPDEAWVRVGTEGFVEAVLVTSGSQVEVGQPLLRLQSPALQAEQERLQSKVEALVAGRFQALQHDAARAGVVEHELQAAQAELERVEERLAQLWVRAERAGRVALPQAQDLPGRYLPRGTRVGHVEAGEPTRVRVVIPQERAALVLAQPGPVSVWRVDAGQHQGDNQGVNLGVSARPSAWSATLVGTPSGGGVTLPSEALGDRHGGETAVDPADAKGLRPLWPVLQADVQLNGPPPGAASASVAPELIGARVWVRFEHARQPLAWQWSRSLQQQVLHHLNPSQ